MFDKRDVKSEASKQDFVVQRVDNKHLYKEKYCLCPLRYTYSYVNWTP